MVKKYTVFDLIFFFSYIKKKKKKMKIGELKTLLTENKINFYTYWNKKRLIALANEHDLLPKIEVKKEENSKDAKYDRLKTIRHNPRKVTLEDVETGK